MKPSVYIETTIPSYLTAWRSPDLMMAANQEATRAWWDTERDHFDLFVSRLVLKEACRGDDGAAERRLQALKGIPVLAATNEAENLAIQLVEHHVMPDKAAEDAMHVAIAAVHGMDYLLTWNCRHIANATIRLGIEDTCRVSGYEPPVICTPQELMED